MHPKDVSSLQPKGSMVERAIRDLEKVVAECELANFASKFGYLNNDYYFPV
jgi:hypothetical protein